MNKHIRLFNVIAPVYAWFFKGQRRRYRDFIKRLGNHCECQSILDVGFGTGALMRELYDAGKEVHGVDGAPRMVRTAKRKVPQIAENLHQGDLNEGLAYEEGAFDCVVSSYVVHGLPSAMRKRYYAEAKRVSKGCVIFYEHSDSPSVLIKIAEFFEGGEFFRFRKKHQRELREHFTDVKTLKMSKSVVVHILR